MEFKSQVATTREQSERLLSFGVRIDTADMCWVDDKLFVSDEEQTRSFVEYPPEDKTDEFYPAWSLSRLLEMMPKDVPDPKPGFNAHHPELIIHSLGYNLSIRRHSGDCLVGTHIEENPIECFVSMIKWLINKKHFDRDFIK